MGQQGEVQFRAFCLVVAHVLHQPAIFARRCAQDFRKGAGGKHDLACQQGEQIQPGGFLGKRRSFTWGYRSSERR